MTTHFIHAGNLIDGSGGPHRKDVVLAIENGMVSAIIPFNRQTPPDPALVIDLSFATLVPPFVDCLVHLALSGSIDQVVRKYQEAASYDAVRSTIKRHLGYLFRHGILAVRDAGDSKGHVLRYQAESWESAAERTEPLVLQVAGQTGDQRDSLHVVNPGGNSLPVFAEGTRPLSAVAEIQHLVARAEQHGKKVMVPASGKIPVQQALEGGCHAIVHGYLMGRKNLRLMAAKQTVLVPTLAAIKACAEMAATAEERKIASKKLVLQLEQVALAKELGVTVALGTDSGCFGVLHGEAVVEEMKLLIKAGYSLVEAVQCATSSGARLMGLDAGLITVGKPAHFLVTRGTPAQLPRKFSYLEAIYLDGNPSPFYRKNPIRGLLEQ